MRWRRTTLATLVAAATVIATALPPGSASADPARAGGSLGGAVTAAPVGSAKAFSVTLITGDRVLVHSAKGAHSAVITPGPGRKGMAFLQRSGGEAGQHTFEVIPLDALRLIEAGRLDRRLFDVLTLQRFAYDDAHASATPLIVTGPGAARSALARFPGTTVTRALPVVDAAAINSSKKDAAAFWASLHRGGSDSSGSTLAAGLTSVHLDGKSTVMDEQSNAQVGAPAAWAAGYTGAGVTAAVLDSGVDETHPDLKGKVADAVDFTGSEDGAKDAHGHGTHVAATIAGSGSASDGKHKGVAPDANLVVGRVCGATGTCQDSDVLAGMEWAASKARIVSMSLGTPEASDGNDLMSRAVNELSAKTGALFVIAAGNSGPRATTVGSPGAADAALTVGSVGRTNAASRFSSRGPRKDGAVKPDITAPGENIISARAVGTRMGSPVDDNYTAASGTSMATPHISGAAAALAQAHPNWTGAQLKATLTGSALPNGDLPFVQGAGRLDLARAVRQAVYTGDALRLGRISAPFATKPVVRKTLTYHNTGAEAVTLSLTASAGIGATPLPAGALTLSAAELTVPAGGGASVEVAVNPSALDGATFGPLSGRVVAKDAASDATVQTVLGGIVEPESYDVTVDMIDRHGKPITIGDDYTHWVQLYSHDLAVAAHGPETDVTASRVTMRVQKGAYALASVITTAETPENTYGTESFTFLTQPKLTVDRDITLTLDAGTAKPIRPALDTPKLQRRNAFVDQRFEVRRGADVVGYSGSTFGTGSTQPFYVRTVGQSDPRYRFLYRSDVATQATVSPAHLYHLAIASQGRTPKGLAGRIRDRDLATVHSRYRAQASNTVGMRAEWIRWYPTQSSFASLFVDDIPLPSRLIEHYSEGGVQYRGLFEQRLKDSYPAPDGTTLTSPRTYKRGAVTRENWNAAVLGPNLGELGDDAMQVARIGDRLYVGLPLFSTPEPNHGMWFNEIFGLRGSTTLRKDGVVIGKTPFAGLGGINLPTADPATYELEVDGTRPYSWVDVGTRLNVKWVFTSAGTGTPDAVRLPLKTVRISAPTLDDNNAARGGGFTPLVLRVQTQDGTTAVPIKSVTAEFSTDDGTTWAPLQVFSYGGYYGALMQNPTVDEKGGYVSLRVKATDTVGGSVEQTHIRAYRLKG